MGQARVVWGGRRGAGGHLGKWAGSAWSRAYDRRGSRRAGMAWGDDLKGGKQTACRGGGGRAGGLGNVGLIFRRVHLALLRGRAFYGRAGGRRIILSTFGAGRARGVGGWMVVPTVGTVGRGGGATIGNGAEVALFGAGGIGTAVFCCSVVKGADGADGMVVLAYRSGVVVPLTVAAMSGFIGRVSDLDFPLARE